MKGDCMEGKSNIAVSLRSRGILLYNQATFFDVRAHLVAVFLDILDLFIAALITATCLSWYGYASVVITIIVVGALGDLNSDSGQLPLSGYFLLFAYILLPLVMLLSFTLRRRDATLTRVAQLKATLVAICLTELEAGGSPLGDACAEVRRRAFTVLSELQRYLQHKRPYTRHFVLPYRAVDPAPTDVMYKTSREIGVLLRRVHRSVRHLHLAVQAVRLADAAQPPVRAPDSPQQPAPQRQQQAPLNQQPLRQPPPQPPLTHADASLVRAAGSRAGNGQQLDQQRQGPGASTTQGHASRRADMLTHLVAELHDAVEGLVVVKEYRSPVILRALVRWYAVLIMPVLLGPYWNQLRAQLQNQAATSGAVAVLTQIALMVVLDVTVGMEDPFDDSSLDNISLVEMVDHIHTMTDLSDTEDLARFTVGQQDLPHNAGAAGAAHSGQTLAGAHSPSASTDSATNANDVEASMASLEHFDAAAGEAPNLAGHPASDSRAHANLRTGPRAGGLLQVNARQGEARSMEQLLAPPMPLPAVAGGGYAATHGSAHAALWSGNELRL